MSILTDSSLLKLVLRTLETRGLADDGKFDWDPITFAFTVQISIFAATFALITIYQAILAAGPGRPGLISQRRNGTGMT
ncbi:hypothetical protein N657DRAFT_448923 [Parathielavia appendiculata]|uniref:Uncharacterized protein n=1 Tax=Parathielavia appendiculata TaxID=2587402 RepID=A0AAN6TZR7_9PEZI|nr:hypothetical protein N657DRAFT_448923 [Parathielavia appendiculata]